ncbi:DUF3010 family protein [Shewanella sp. NIFS-20-20]|uniref:DUF3010 family protein n=1 Tax=Shewanella sp. NIFS-20-20 TaxID=2853806 RepID=UPI001C47ED5F|nr:DUF3010 family protein [Shewanella sp. NIFS-20-20]MBV7315179.1 DUF3010 family protein [Shewanella sp. NIFS-20-20]
MRVCGVELKGGEAIICLLEQNADVFVVPACRKQSFAVPQSATTEAMRKFQFDFDKLMEDYHVDQIVIVEREQKGKFAGSATSFKLEAAIQLTDLPVSLIKPVEIKAQLKRNPPVAAFDGLDLKKFQQLAFEAAYAQHMNVMYNKD